MGRLPHFNPDDDREGEPVAAAVADLRAQVRAADAIVICTPEYAGAVPGALKNLLEGTVGDGGTYAKPVAWINVSGPAAPTGGADAHDSLRKVLGYVHAEPIEAACTRLPLTRDAVGVDGSLSDPDARQAVAKMLATLVTAAADADIEGVLGPRSLRILTVPSSDGGAVTITCEDVPEPDCWNASLRSPGTLVADAQLHTDLCREGHLAEYFASLAAAWRGWDGERAWRLRTSMLEFTATNDGRGQVKLAVGLYPTYQSWSAQAVLAVDAGALTTIARDAERFDPRPQGP